MTKLGTWALGLSISMASLSTSAGGAHGLRPTAIEVAGRAREICLTVMRIPQGFVPFHECVESLTQSGTRIAPSTDVSRLSTSFTKSERSYSESTFQERRLKEENACAGLGHAPDSATFLLCVADLDADLHSSERSD
jgi:hypothetical protein